MHPTPWHIPHTWVTCTPTSELSVPHTWDLYTSHLNSLDPHTLAHTSPHRRTLYPHTYLHASPHLGSYTPIPGLMYPHTWSLCTPIPGVYAPPRSYFYWSVGLSAPQDRYLCLFAKHVGSSGKLYLMEGPEHKCAGHPIAVPTASHQLELGLEAPGYLPERWRASVGPRLRRRTACLLPAQ